MSKPLIFFPFEIKLSGGLSIFCPVIGGGDEGPLALTNVEKLSLPTNTAVGTQVAVSDGFWVSGFGDARDGFYFDGGQDWNSDPIFVKPGVNYAGFSVPNEIQGQICYHGDDGWVFNDALGAVSADNNAATPWASTWTGLTLTHPALQQLAAPSTAQGGVFVAGGTQDGVYTRRADLDTGNAANVFRLVGASGSDVATFTAYRVLDHDEFDEMVILSDTPGTRLYYSLSDVATPDLATDWKNASDDTPASITVTSVSQGELAAGFKIAGVTYQVNGSENGRNKYSDVAGNVVDNIVWVVGHAAWEQNSVPINSGDVAFPWQGTPEVTVTRDDVASESSWEAVP